MLYSIRVNVCSTSASPSLLASSSAGVRFPRNARGVDSQCVAFCSSPNTATAWAITGTRRATTLGDVTTRFYRESPVRMSLRSRVHLPTSRRIRIRRRRARIGQIALHPFHGLVTRHDHLRDAVARMHGVRLPFQIQQDDANLAAIAGVDGPGAFGIVIECFSAMPLRGRTCASYPGEARCAIPVGTGAATQAPTVTSSTACRSIPASSSGPCA